MGAEAEEYDLYDVLNLQQDASGDDVRAAFRDLSRLYHPDKQRANASSAGGGAGLDEAGVAGAENAFMRVHRAYRVLGDDVLRSFYDRYGLSGVRLAENLSDDEAEGPEAGGQLCLPEDRLKDLEGRVRSLMRRRQELRTQRLLALSGTFTLAAVAAPGVHGAHLRRRYNLQYCATSHSVQIAVCEKLKLTVGCASHVQGANGVGAAKLMLAAASQISPLTTVRAGLNVTGTSPEIDLSVVRALNENCTVQQKVSCSGDGMSMSFAVFPWLSKTMRGNLSATLGEDPNLQLGLLKRSTASGHSARAFLNLQTGGGELGAQIKYKATRDFALKLQPSLSQNGWVVQVTCTKVVADDCLTKLHWILRLRRRNAQVRLTLARAGLRFSMPIELWPDMAGPLPPADYAVVLAIWALPPLFLRLGWLLFRGVRHFFRSKGAAASSDGGAADGFGAGGASAGAARAGEGDGEVDVGAIAAAEAQEQRRLVEREAARCRSREEGARGLEILRACYGEAAAAASAAAGAPLRAAGAGPGAAVDVTDCLMAKVRQSRLYISDAPKYTLLGFYNPSQGGSAPVLHIRYRFGGVEHERTFGDTEIVLLP
mmetsp:Transcript_158799/g.509044  ORF Transcript_158799/g.509044 Transcript_158799/m.509044 type:complete len:598 (+) Transcript_158799:119-1912(+)